MNRDCRAYCRILGLCHGEFRCRFVNAKLFENELASAHVGGDGRLRKRAAQRARQLHLSGSGFLDNLEVLRIDTEIKRVTGAAEGYGFAVDQDLAMERRESYDGPEVRPLGERCVVGFGSTGGPPKLPVSLRRLPP